MQVQKTLEYNLNSKLIYNLYCCSVNTSLSFYSASKLDFMTSSKHNNGTGRDCLDE